MRNDKALALDRPYLSSLSPAYSGKAGGATCVRLLLFERVGRVDSRTGMSSLLCQSPAPIMESGHSCPEVLPLRLSHAYSGKAGGATCVRLRAGTKFRHSVDATDSIRSRQAILSRHPRACQHTVGPRQDFGSAKYSLRKCFFVAVVQVMINFGEL